MTIRHSLFAAAFVAGLAGIPAAAFAADAMSAGTQAGGAMAGDAMSSDAMQGDAMQDDMQQDDMAMQDCMKAAEKESDAVKSAEMKTACETKHTDAMGGDAMAPQN